MYLFDVFYKGCKIISNFDFIGNFIRMLGCVDFFKVSGFGWREI